MRGLADLYRPVEAWSSSLARLGGFKMLLINSNAQACNSNATYCRRGQPQPPDLHFPNTLSGLCVMSWISRSR